MKNIYILLTRSTTILSKVVHLVTRDKFTHASISFEDNLQPLYSSSRKNGITMFPAGPCKEQLHKGLYKLNPQIPCALYVLEVEDDVYYKAKREAETIIGDGDIYHFNIIGLILCRLNIKFQRRKKFFCSQFVGEVLRRSDALELPKHTSLIRPSDYMAMAGLECMFMGELCELIQWLAVTLEVGGIV